MMDLDIKTRIRVLRADEGWSQAELAEKVGVSLNSLNTGGERQVRSLPPARIPHRRGCIEQLPH